MDLLRNSNKKNSQQNHHMNLMEMMTILFYELNIFVFPIDLQEQLELEIISVSIQLIYLKMDSQINRILSSSLNTQILDTFNSNEESMNRLQSILQEKNSHIYHLQAMIKNELQTTVLENEKLRKSNNLYRREIRTLRSSIIRLKNEALMGIRTMTQDFDFLKQITQTISHKLNNEQQFREENNQIHQKAQKEKQTVIIKMEDKCLQTEEQKKNIETQLLQRISKLEQTVMTLKQEKWQLAKQMQKRSVGFTQEQDYFSCKSEVENEKVRQKLKTDGSNNFNYSTYKEYISDENQKKYQGNVIKGQKNGYAICQYQNNFSYEGTFVNGMKFGQGVLKFQDTILYQGHWRDNMPHGKGMIFYPEDERIEKVCGQFEFGKLNGYGTVVYRGGRRLRTRFRLGECEFTGLLQDEQDGLVLGEMLSNTRFRVEQSHKIVAV